MIQVEQLQPLIYPDPISWWPPAPGWWLLLLLSFFIVAVTRYYNTRSVSKKNSQAPSDPIRDSALQQLNKLTKPQADEPAGPWLQQLNQLLKRICATRYPEHACHTLSGRDWLAFLDNRCPAAGLSRWMVLVQGAYQADCRLDDAAITQLHNAIETWIRKHV